MFALYFNFDISIVEIKNTDLFFQIICYNLKTLFSIKVYRSPEVLFNRYVLCFKESKNVAVEKNFKGTIYFYRKQCLPVIRRNKKHLSKKVVPIT